MSTVAGQVVVERTLAVDLHGLTLTVTCPIPAVAAALEARLAHLARAPEAGAEMHIAYRVDREPHEAPADARLVYESEHGTLHYAPESDELYARYGGEITMRCEPERGFAEVAVPEARTGEVWLLSRPMLTLPLMEMARRRGLYPLHAACLARDGRGLLVAGPSGSGKSTLAIALVRAGLDFLGDDLVFHTGAASPSRLLGFPDEIGIAPGVESAFPDLAQPAPPGWPKARLDVTAVASTRVVSECRPGLLVLLSEDDREVSLEPVSSDEALLEILPTVLLTHQDTCAGHLAALGALVAATRPLRAYGRAGGEVVTELLEALEDLG